MTQFFELLLQEAVNHNVDLPVVVTVNGMGTIRGEIDSSQPLSRLSIPEYTRLLNASMVDLQAPGDEPSYRVPRPPISSAVSIPGGPNRRWLVMIGSTYIVGEEVEWDQWLDYNSTTNGGDWDPAVVASLKSIYPLHVDVRAFFHLIDVRFLSTQVATGLGGPVYVPTKEINCCGDRW
jgi:hypothetical protein